jgi:ferredoxin
MKPEKISLIYFSPTSTTKLILNEIAKGIDKKVSTVIDITNPEVRNQISPEFKNSVVLIGAPVYAGRIAKDAVDYFKTINGSGALAIIVVVYGNREFEDAMLELKNITVDSSFIPFAAGAFIGEHSFSNNEFLIAPDRPDENDLEKALLFGKQIAYLLNSVKPQTELTPVHVPGDFPYRDGMGNSAFSFINVTADCDDCGICVDVCPKNAVDESNGYSTVDKNCIFCCACIKACPQQARILKDGPIKEKAKWLSENCAHRKEPQTYLSDV